MFFIFNFAMNITIFFSKSSTEQSVCNAISVVRDVVDALARKTDDEKKSRVAADEWLSRNRSGTAFSRRSLKSFAKIEREKNKTFQERFKRVVPREYNNIIR